MQTGTPTEKKVFEAAQKIRDAYLYVSDNINKNGTWEDKSFNALIRLKKDGSSLNAGLADLATDFLEISDPDNFKQMFPHK